MGKWKNKFKILKDKKVGQKIIIKYKWIGHDIPEIKSITTPMGCSLGDYNKKTKNLVFSYIVQKPPKNKKSYTTLKQIEIEYKKRNKEFLSFKCKVNE